MEDEGIAPNTVHTADPVGMGRKACRYTIIMYSVYWRDCLPIPTGSAACIVGAISSSSILRAHLYTTPSSMVVH